MLLEQSLRLLDFALRLVFFGRDVFLAAFETLQATFEAVFTFAHARVSLFDFLAALRGFFFDDVAQSRHFTLRFFAGFELEQFLTLFEVAVEFGEFALRF